MIQTITAAMDRIRFIFRDKRIRWALISAGVTAFVAYAYGMLNNINNYDTIYNTPCIGVGGAQSGRWLLSILTRIVSVFGGLYSLPFFDILASLLMLSVSCVLLCRIFRLRDAVSYALLSMVTISFPAVASATFFAYTMHYYMFALWMIVFGFWLTERRGKIGYFVLLAFLLAFAAGIYQAYYPFAIALAVLLLIADCLRQEKTAGGIFVKGVKYFVTILVSYGLYRFFLKLCLTALGKELSDYQGVNEMGKVELAALPGMLKQMFVHYFLLPTHNYMELTTNVVGRFCVLALMGFVALLLLLGWREKNVWKNIELFGLLLIALPIASNFIIIMVPHGTVYSLMAMGLISLFYLPILILNTLPIKAPDLKRVLTAGLGCVLLLSSLNYAYMSNGCYKALEFTNIQTEQYFAGLYARIRAMDGYDENDPVVFAGDIFSDAAYTNKWNEPTFNYGGVRQYGIVDPDSNGINEYSRDRFIRLYLGYDVRDITEEEAQQYAAELSEMRTYPNDDSIRILDNKVIVKLDENPNGRIELPS